ncbi:MAG: acyltransferase family protein [Lachnospiraceae bacterium]
MQKQFTKEHSFIVKGFAILLLLIYHLFEHEQLVTSLEVNYTPFSLTGFLMFTGFGNICVAMFVFLTAFGIATGLFAQPEITPAGAYRQATKRFFLLMTNFTILYISVNLLWWYKFDYQSLYGVNKQGFLYALTDATGLSMFFDTPTLNMTWWYMEIAYLLIFLVPLLVWLVKKIGYPVLILAILAPSFISFNPDMERYLFTAVFGVCAAYGKWPDKLLNLKLHPVLQWLTGIVGFVLCVLIRQNFVVQESYIHLVDAPIALFLVYFAGALLGRIPGLGKVLAFIGRYSMNIYLVHTFFYMSLWQKFIYQFKYAGITFLLLLGVSLLYSVLLELLKKVTGFQKLMARFHG